ncbi:MAG: hypothetical protein ACLFTH_01925 [Candidatus Woesearchaeota archaeon]
MHVSRAQISGNSLVGLYILPLQDKILLGTEVSDSLKKTIEDVFDGEVIQASIAGTPLLGVFAATDGEKVIVPHIIFDHEKKVLDDAGIEYEIIRSDLTCHGNNLVVTKKGLLANPEYEKEAIESIELFFEQEATPFTFEETPTVGSYIAHNSKYGLVSHDFSEETLQKLSDILGLVLTTGTVNMGATQIKSGVAVNDHGFMIGENSGGPEVVNADEGLGFINAKDESDYHA